MSTLGIVAPEAATIGTLAAVRSHSSKKYAMTSHKGEGPHDFPRLFVQLLRGDPLVRLRNALPKDPYRPVEVTGVELVADHALPRRVLPASAVPMPCLLPAERDVCRNDRAQLCPVRF